MIIIHSRGYINNDKVSWASITGARVIFSFSEAEYDFIAIDCKSELDAAQMVDHIEAMLFDGANCATVRAYEN